MMTLNNSQRKALETLERCYLSGTDFGWVWPSRYCQPWQSFKALHTRGLADKRVCLYVGYYHDEYRITETGREQLRSEEGES